MDHKAESSKGLSGKVLLISAALLCIVFYYGANLQLRQSIVEALTLAAICSYFSYYLDGLQSRIGNSLQKPDRKFLPYWVRIDPKWEKILLDFHLISSLDEWESIKKDVWNNLPFGIAFTVLRDESDSSDMLVYEASVQNTLPFKREVEVCRDIEPINFRENRSFRLRIFAEQTGTGYELGIIVPVKWWDGVNATCPRPVREDPGDEYCEVKLILAMIPHTEFAWYCRQERGIGPSNMFKADHQRQVYEEWRRNVATNQHEERKRWGWGRSDLFEGGQEMIENSYFSVQHSSIQQRTAKF